MNEEQTYTAWTARRADVPVPEGFADRVMAALAVASPEAPDETARAPEPDHPVTAGKWSALVASPLGRAAVLTLALAACLFRMVQAVGHFVTYGALS